MRIGVRLPASIPGVAGTLVLEWARRAEAGPFASLGVIDRVVYPNCEPLVTLGAAAALTRRVRLVSSVLIGPAHDAGLLAKQAATIDVLSNGRLTLGVGVGSRADDFQATGTEFRGRGRRLEEQIAVMRRIWAGEPLDADTGPIGPRPVQPGGPELLLGGAAPAALRRAGRLAAGWLSGGDGDTARCHELYGVVEAAWQAAGRPGRPQFVGVLHYALGPEARERGGAYLRDYNAQHGAAAERVVAGMQTSADTIRQTLARCEQVGMDEVIFSPCIADLAQLDRLAEIVAATA